MNDVKDGAWFAPKRFGYGSGWPIAWQGWVLLITHVTIILGGTTLIQNETAKLAWIVTFTILPMPLYAAKTRGGWRWRGPGSKS